MAEPYQIRSDFADEIISADIQPKTYEHIEKKNDHTRGNYTRVLCDENESGKRKGDYIFIECRNPDDHAVRENMTDAIQENLQHMSDSMHATPKKILVVGLGNRFITLDTLGPQAANEILMTIYLYEHESLAYLRGTCNIAVLQSNVIGQTGLGSLSIIQSVVQSYQSDLTITIDVLAICSIVRINRAVQINNTGIQPRSGVGSHWMLFCKKSLRIPTIATGVATVTNIGAVLYETLEVSGEEKQRILQKIQDSSYLNLVVTPKSMGDESKHLVYIVSENPNRFLHPNYERLQCRILSSIT